MPGIFTPNHSSVFYLIKQKFGMLVEPIHANMLAQSGARSIELHVHYVASIIPSINIFYAYSSQRKAPMVLQIYVHAQIINVFKHIG